MRAPMAITMRAPGIPEPDSHAFVANVGMAASRRAVLTTLIGVASTLPALRPASAAGQAAVQVFPIVSAELDRRSFRGLLLPNGLRVLLASDPASTKGAAAMDVQVGYMSDPGELPGCAVTKCATARRLRADCALVVLCPRQAGALL